MDSSEVGRLGTLRLMKRLEPYTVVASYPIDEEEITIGRDTSCSIRLYYETVSALHCKIIFRERKAFLVVLGINGLLVDGCPVFPATGPGGSPVTVPLPNNSVVEINKKCFQFSYPPKELRATLIDTPTRPDELTPDRKRRRRTLRMSMIQSAQVFTPRPSNDPRENLRILKTPIKTPFSKFDRRQSSPLKRGMYIPEEEEEEEEEEDIVLVETNHPKVVEEDKDLVILEHVTVEIPEPQPQQPGPAQAPRLVQFPIPQNGQLQIQTPPRRRLHPRASLHRAVLIRSAQRTAMKVEMEREEEREAEEVEETIQALDMMEGVQEEDDGHEDDAEDMDDDDEQVVPVEQQNRGPFSGLRKSLELVTGWALRQTSVPRDEQQQGEEEEYEVTQDANYEPTAETHTAEDEEDDHMKVEDHDGSEEEPDTVAPLPLKSPVRSRPLGKFMTPQAQRVGDFGVGPSQSRMRGHARYSVGGFIPGGIHGTPVLPIMTSRAATPSVSGPRRVRLVEPWKVEDIMVPLADPDRSVEDLQEDDDIAELSMQSRSVTLSPSKRLHISEEERQAIIDRRRSALTAPDTFFGGEIPGSRRLSLFPPASPIKLPAKSAAIFGTPAKESALSMSDESSAEREASTDEDSQILLARMKQMVEGVKRRQSMGPRPSLAVPSASSPKKTGFSLLAFDPNSPPVKHIDVAASQDDEEPMMDNGADPTVPVTHGTDTTSQDVEMETQNRSSGEIPGRGREPQTPQTADLHGIHQENTGSQSFQDIREMSVESTQPAIPQIDELEQQRDTVTPLEGVGETSEPSPGRREQPVTEPPTQEEQQSLQRGPIRRVTKTVRADQAPVARRVAPRSMTSAQSTSKDDHAVSEDEQHSTAQRPPAARVARRPVRGKHFEAETEQEESGAARPVRRTRKTSESPAPEPASSTAKSLRKPRGAKTPTPTPEEPVSRPTASSRKRAKTPIPEADEEDAAARSGATDGEETTTAASKVRRSTRGRSTVEVKEEEEDIAATAKVTTASTTTRLFAPRALRGRRPAASGLPTASSASRLSSGSRNVRNTSTTRKGTPALSKGSADAAPVVGNKENTPEPQKASADDNQPQVSNKAASKLTKVTRSASKTRAAAEGVGDKNGVDTAKSRVSRPRTRTASGR